MGRVEGGRAGEAPEELAPAQHAVMPAVNPAFFGLVGCSVRVVTCLPPPPPFFLPPPPPPVLPLSTFLSPVSLLCAIAPASCQLWKVKLQALISRRPPGRVALNSSKWYTPTRAVSRCTPSPGLREHGHEQRRPCSGTTTFAAADTPQVSLPRHCLTRH